MIRRPGLPERVIPRRLLAALPLAALLACSGGGDADREPSSELDQRIAELRDRADRRADSAEEMGERLRTLRDWADQLAAREVPLPRELGGQVAAGLARLATAAGPEETERVLAETGELVAGASRELAAKSDDEQVLGELAIEPATVEAGEWTTLELTWTVGSSSMREGGALVITATGGCRGIQADDPAAAGYVAVATSRAGAELTAGDDWSESLVPAGRQLAWRLSGQDLGPGDTVSITVGDRSAGGPGLRMPTGSSDHVSCPVRMDLSGSGEAWTPAWPAFAVRGREEILALTVLAPSVVAVDEPFDLAVRSEDRFANLASAPAPRYRVQVGDRRLPSIPAGAGAMTVLEDLRLDEPGVYRFEVRTDDGRLRARSNPLRVVDQPAERVYWGDLHGGSSLGGGDGTPTSWYRFARDTARLDFAALSERIAALDATTWITLVDAATRFTDPGEFTALVAAEWAPALGPGAAQGVYLADPLDATTIPAREALSPADLNAALRSLGAPARALAVDFGVDPDERATDDEIEPIVEIRSGRVDAETRALTAVARGRRVGFAGASGGEDAHPGHASGDLAAPSALTAVLARENRAEALFHALRERATYVTTGERVLLDVSLDDRSPGATLARPEQARVSGRVWGTAPIASVELLRNGRVVAEQHFGTQRPRGRLLVEVALEPPSAGGEADTAFSGATWQGTVEVRGATLTGLRRPSVHHPRSLEVSRDDTRDDVVAWSANDAGRAFVVELDGVGRETEIEVAWLRLPDRTDEEEQAASPPGRVVLRPAEAQDGRLAQAPRNRSELGSIALELFSADAPSDREIDISDPTAPAGGDAYVLRLRQIDGGIVWSSPWWVE